MRASVAYVSVSLLSSALPDERHCLTLVHASSDCSCLYEIRDAGGLKVLSCASLRHQPTVRLCVTLLL